MSHSSESPIKSAIYSISSPDGNLVISLRDCHPRGNLIVEKPTKSASNQQVRFCDLFPTKYSCHLLPVVGRYRSSWRDLHLQVPSHKVRGEGHPRRQEALREEQFGRLSGQLWHSELDSVVWCIATRILTFTVASLICTLHSRSLVLPIRICSCTLPPYIHPAYSYSSYCMDAGLACRDVSRIACGPLLLMERMWVILIPIVLISWIHQIVLDECNDSKGNQLWKFKPICWLELYFVEAT